VFFVLSFGIHWFSLKEDSSLQSSLATQEDSERRNQTTKLSVCSGIFPKILSVYEQKSWRQQRSNVIY